MGYRISHAQNFEDVMLWRALGGIPQGRYIDIGAQSPDIDSVSRIFHEAGWRGLHVDANVDYAAQLRAARPGDTVVQAAVTDHEGLLRFYEIPDTGLSTLRKDVADRHAAQGFAVRETDVATTTLDALFDLAAEEIHWLKIDVEGGEEDVLRSWRTSSVRPWIIVIESTSPLTPVESHSAWEPMLLEKGYKFVWFDGLNRFYVSAAHPELGAAFMAPPNVFDEFALSGDASSPFCRVVTHERDEARAQAARDRDAAETAGQAAAASEAARAAIEAAHAEALKVAEDLRQSIAAWIEVARTRESHILQVELRLRNTEQQVRETLAAREQLDRQLEQARQVAARVPELEEERARLWAERDRLGEQMSQRECELAEVRHALDALHASHSWRVTRPLRDARRIAGSATAAMRGLARRIVRWPLALAVSVPPVRALARRLLAGRPELAERLLLLSGRAGVPVVQAAPPAPPMVLTPRAQAILRAMRTVESGHEREA